MAKYDTETKPALRAVETAFSGLRLTLNAATPEALAERKAVVDAAAKAGATPYEIADAVGGRDTWNKFVRALKGAGLV